MSLDVRTVTASDYPDWLRAVQNGFLTAGSPAEDDVADRLAATDLTRLQGAFDAGRCVATFRSFAQRLTVVGGATVPADAITGVTVAPTHRRRGLLSRMMATDLAAARERGEVVATLIAAEYPIYGRFGFGPATWTAEWEVSVHRAGLDPRRSGQPEDGGRIEMVDGADVRKYGPELHARLAALRPGVVSRSERWWRRHTGTTVIPAHEKWTEPFYVIHRDADGEVDGLLVYGTDDKWGDAKQPLNTATVRDLIAVTPAAERALWHFLCSVDWITTVRSGYRAPDDLLPQLLPDPRAARTVTHADWLWLRILDVERALEARTYESEASLVLDVRDEGRFLLDVSPEGARCTPTTRSADLALGAGELAALYLGDESARRLADLGRAEELRTGAAGTADAIFRTGRRPWCPDIF
ncbi:MULTISPECIES: GNAT family N-acetyltransferase [unclassified Streptomyces]|uniref:GNAT family N-acetyltransferase n=1 Tax=unclassified Streptomyces TaxID=2593676 RepID=UPI00081DF80E|nr:MULTISPECIES: GNAT family N-acetyltransferase [unclassified Streptomyces]MYR95405.1 GNAT family N-acetyltransferase [Streptomyces sp. SID4937]SCD89519.1 Predicted acetyltransferase [Streptomyces sp. ScaeMP-e83]